ncbi:MAG TPA: 50S ribosomal protein L11 methyltransferase [Opitutaceae bacterium]|jgi:ribosomal protein L11 methyltransferase|nr:50S ribosomal protein L11 methyltransferase [Opitutaceae bacterium]
MALAELKAEVPATAADAIDELLLELGDGRWSLLEDALAKRAWVVGVFADEAEARARWTDLAPALPAPPAEPAVRVLADADWRESYRAHFRRWQFGRLHWVPQWERDSFRLPPGEAVLWLDPGLAFGTGNHETTRLVIERLVERAGALAEAGRPLARIQVVDAGCGSGILALSAALLGFGAVSGFDLDPEAVRVSGENAALNGLAGRVRFSAAGLDDGLAGVSAGVVLANIQSDVLAAHAAALRGAVAPGGILILSGILAAELPAVQAAFAPGPGWTAASRTLGEWAELALSRV